MKHLLKFATLALMFGMFTFTSCDKDDSNDEATIGQVEEALKSGTWEITRFDDSGTNRNADVDEYTFSFESLGALTVTGGVVSPLVGGWTVTDGDLNSDAVTDLNLGFFIEGVSGGLGDVTRTWDVTEFKNDEIKLRLDDDYVTLSKK